MNSILQVEGIRSQMEQEGAGKPDIIRQLALACLDWPYVFGAWGEECTPQARRRRARDDHPTIVSKCPSLSGRGTCADCQWGIGVRMFDCRGYTAWLLRQVGLDLTGQGATSQYNTVTNWVRRGEIKSMPDVVCCVFRKKGNSMEHTGMHVGGGVVIDCSTGVSSVGMRGWTHYGIPVGLYEEGEIPVDVVKPVLRKGDRGEEVKGLQIRLTELGYDCGEADGVFGTRTKNAVVRFQTANGLDPDGVVGHRTWAVLDSIQPAETYRVTIEGVTLSQYKRILEICPLAECERERG
jgi:hypothetical protein